MSTKKVSQWSLLGYSWHSTFLQAGIQETKIPELRKVCSVIGYNDAISECEHEITAQNHIQQLTRRAGQK